MTRVAICILALVAALVCAACAHAVTLAADGTAFAIIVLAGHTALADCPDGQTHCGDLCMPVGADAMSGIVQTDLSADYAD